MDFKLRKAIREAYKKYLPVIISRYPKRYDPYIFDFDIPLTPIEQNVWSDIRYLGLPFFMQVPVGKYFVDFGDPIKKIGIEVDGKKWHKDYEKDESRTKDLNAMGWTIFRMPGRVTFKTQDDYLVNNPDYPEGEILPEYYWECSEGILKKLEQNYYLHAQLREDYPMFASSLKC